MKLTFLSSPGRDCTRSMLAIVSTPPSSSLLSFPFPSSLPPSSSFSFLFLNLQRCVGEIPSPTAGTWLMHCTVRSCTDGTVHVQPSAYSLVSCMCFLPRVALVNHEPQQLDLFSRSLPESSKCLHVPRINVRGGGICFTPYVSHLGR